MKKRLLHQKLQTIPAPQGLLEHILLQIALRRRRDARTRASLLGALALASALLLIPALQYAGQEFYASGFSTYLSLMFSDAGMIGASWRAFVLLLIESLPSIAILLLLALGGTLGWSLTRLLRTLPAALRPRGV